MVPRAKQSRGDEQSRGARLVPREKLSRGGEAEQRAAPGSPSEAEQGRLQPEGRARRGEGQQAAARGVAASTEGGRPERAHAHARLPDG